MQVRPLSDWVVVRLEPLPETSPTGIVLIGSGAERQREGTVLRIGPGRWLSKKKNVRRPLGAAVGDRVVFFRENLEHQQGKEVTRIVQELEDNVGMIRDDDILFVVEE